MTLSALRFERSTVRDTWRLAMSLAVLLALSLPRDTMCDGAIAPLPEADGLKHLVGGVRHAFEDLGLDMLDGICATANTGSRRVFEKNGFHLDGTLPQVIENNAGDILDAHFFSQSRDAWRQAHQKV